MRYITLNNLTQSYGDFDVFTGLSAQIEADSKIGLVGPNGIGKTTLLQLIAGLADSSGGTVTLADDLEIGYLRQEAVQAFANTTNTLHHEMLTVFEPVKAMERRMREIERHMTDGSATDDEYDEYGTLQEEFELRGGYDYERRIERTLEGLGFALDAWQTPLQHLSGGQKTRALLAKLLLTTPHLLILDEPTNHLDIQAVRWLEGTLKLWPGALLIVSHDRYFLDKVVNTIWEMSRTGIESYRGNYSAYVQQRQHRRERAVTEWDSMMERFWHEFKFIEKNPADPRAQGRMKILAREVDAVQNHGLSGYRAMKQMGWGQYTNAFERKRPPQTIAELRSVLNSLKKQHPIQHTHKMRVKLEAEERSGDVVLRTHNLKIGYPNKPLFNADNVELMRGDIAALIGPNGAGKSTLLKTLMRQLDPLRGRITRGASLQIGYFAQAHDTLEQDNTVLQEMMRYDDALTPADARHYLAPYLFKGDDVFKPVHRLSGGERGRLSLAILAKQGANFLLLDEPTNHLDIPAQEVLQEVLEQFDGTILLVTHDRYLVDRLATQIWDLNAGHMRVFKGTYQAYLDMLEAEQLAQAERPASTPAPQPEPPAIDPLIVNTLETKITALEGGIRELDVLLTHASAAGDGDSIQQLSRERAHQQTRLNALLQEWESLLEGV